MTSNVNHRAPDPDTPTSAGGMTMPDDDYITEDGPAEGEWNGEPHPDTEPTEG